MTMTNKLTKKQVWDIYEAFKDLTDQYEIFHYDAVSGKDILGMSTNILWQFYQSYYRLHEMIRQLRNLGIELEADDNTVIARCDHYIDQNDLNKAIKEAYDYNFVRE